MITDPALKILADAIFVKLAEFAVSAPPTVPFPLILKFVPDCRRRSILNVTRIAGWQVAGQRSVDRQIAGESRISADYEITANAEAAVKVAGAAEVSRSAYPETCPGLLLCSRVPNVIITSGKRIAGVCSFADRS